jgi:L-alanine-DL-glutamate epimerase-like enolase superfamily enzyme
MRITALETFATRDVAFVRLTAEDGGTGWGQLSPYNADITAQVFHRQIAPWALGRDTGALETLVAEIPEREHKFPGSYLRRALAGLDTAVWDWRGRRAGLPVTALIGGTPGPLRAYASSMRRDIAPEDEAARLARLRDDQGFDAFKIRVGRECGHDADEWPGRTEAIVPAVRRALGPEPALLADANSGFSPARAIEVGRILEAEGVEHLEEPCPYWRLEETAEVRAALALDVAGGEQDCDLEQWGRIVALPAVDVIQPDILYVGGLLRALEVARMGAAAGLPCTPHCANRSMVTLFTMHLLRAIPNAGKYLELSIEGPEVYPWEAGLLLGDPYRVEDGRVTVTDAPGWGAEPHPDWLVRAAHMRSEADG